MSSYIEGVLRRYIERVGVRPPPVPLTKKQIDQLRHDGLIREDSAGNLYFGEQLVRDGG